MNRNAMTVAALLLLGLSIPKIAAQSINVEKRIISVANAKSKAEQKSNPSNQANRAHPFIIYESGLMPPLAPHERILGISLLWVNGLLEKSGLSAPQRNGGTGFFVK